LNSAHRIVGRARVASAIALALVVLGACEAAESTATGIVVDVEGTTVTEIQAFTLRTQPGQDVRFEIGQPEMADGAFPASHLREHMALASAVVVDFRPDGERLVAFRLSDAP
jgi:hypothetical protein